MARAEHLFRERQHDFGTLAEAMKSHHKPRAGIDGFGQVEKITALEPGSECAVDGIIHSCLL